MYENHFGLKCRPFRATPDSGCYFAASSHESALTRLFEAVHEEEGLVMVTGEPGTGKTLLCHRLLERVGTETPTIFLTNCQFLDRASLLQAILFDLSLPYAGQSEQELRLKLTEFLLDNFKAGRRTVAVVDEAQHLLPSLLEELRLLGNLEARQGKAIQIILVAQPAILELLSRPELAAFNQRLSVRIELEPLGVHEAVDYLMQYIRAAGGEPETIFTSEAFEMLARGTKGVPRLLNQAAHQSMCLAHAFAAASVDAEVVLEALSRLGLDAEAALKEESSLSAVAEPMEMSEEEVSEPLPRNGLHAPDEKPEPPDKKPPKKPGRSRRLFGPNRRPA